MIKGLIFDMDDTLVNSSSIHKSSVALVLEKYGVTLNTLPKEIESKFFGKRPSEVLEIIINHYKLDKKLEDILKEREKLISKMLKNVKPMPGLETLLGFLKSSSYTLALASSSSKKDIRTIMKKFKMDSLFKVVVSGDDVQLGKPHPEIYLKAVKKMNLSPRECCAFEDSENGIISAKKAGMKIVAVKNSLMDWKQDLSKADIVINDLNGVEDAIRKIDSKI